MTKQKAICILGMHRSGTSAIARAVNLVGAYICREDQLMPPKADNHDGFWEHMEIYSFHERLLEYLSRSWDSVISMPEEWWKKPGLEPYRLELMDLILREFEGQPLWMWKDPRTSLLLPLWKEVLQELEIDVSYLLCIRNPLDVVASLKRRDDFSKFKSLALWHLYNLSSCYWTDGCKRAVVHYDHFLEQWEPSLRKIAAFLDIPWPREDNPWRSAIADFLKPSSRHSHSDLGLLKEDRDVPEAVVSLYRLLLESQENPSSLDSIESKDYMSEPQTDYSHFFSRMYAQPWGIIATANTLRVEQELKQKEDAIVKLNQAIETNLREKETHIANLERHIGDLEAVVRDKEGHIGNLETMAREKDRRIESIELALRDKETQIGSLQSAVTDKDTHIGNLERQREENYRDWQAHTKSLELIVTDKDTHIGNLERQREENYRDWQAHTKSLELIVTEKDTHIGNLERQREENDRDWQAHTKSLELIVTEKDTHIGNLERQREENDRDWQAHTKSLELIVTEKDTHIGTLERQREENYRDWEAHTKSLELMVMDKDAHIGNFETAVRDKDAHISNLEASLRIKDSQIGSLEDTLKEKHGTLNYIYNSYGLGALLVCNKMIDKIFPLNSKRRRYAKTILNTIKIKTPKNPVKNSNKLSY